MKLPKEFLANMQRLLGPEYEQFLDSYNISPYAGLRINTLKVDVERFLKLTSMELSPIPWCPTGFYYNNAVERPAKHPYYHAGLYYLQEPSAMAPGSAAYPKPGEKILDLCAAPGGKSTQLAAALGGEGVLVSNDVDEDRVKALTKNLELYGIRNAVVTNEQPRRLAEVFHGYFDKVLVDAPCSGEGMFRKDPGAVRSWESFTCRRCGAMQREILTYAASMVRAGGRIIYSTCTFAPEEDEMTIDWFLDTFPEFELKPVPFSQHFDHGRPEWGSGRPELALTSRLWPHKLKGEGHFVAVLERMTEGSRAVPEEVEETRGGKGRPRGRDKGAASDYPVTYRTEVPEAFGEFVREMLTEPEAMFLVGQPRTYALKGHNLYLPPWGVPDLSRLKTPRPGWFLGSIERGRFEPSNAFATALKVGQVCKAVDLPSSRDEVIRYLKGETLNISGDKGWVLVTTDGFSLGWAKYSDGFLKNYYPKWWRWTN